MRTGTTTTDIQSGRPTSHRGQVLSTKFEARNLFCIHPRPANARTPLLLQADTIACENLTTIRELHYHLVGVDHALTCPSTRLCYRRPVALVTCLTDNSCSRTENHILKRRRSPYSNSLRPQVLLTMPKGGDASWMTLTSAFNLTVGKAPLSRKSPSASAVHCLFANTSWQRRAKGSSSSTGALGHVEFIGDSSSSRSRLFATGVTAH